MIPLADVIKMKYLDSVSKDYNIVGKALSVPIQAYTEHDNSGMTQTVVSEPRIRYKMSGR